jgi:hypothetical protein
MDALTTTPEWVALIDHHAQIGTTHLRDLFAEDPERGRRLVTESVGLTLDYSKQRVTDETISLLTALARARGVESKRDAMFAGKRINVTEDRSVLHVALRMPKQTQLMVEGTDVVAEVHAVLDKMGTFCDAVRSGAWVGHTGLIAHGPDGTVHLIHSAEPAVREEPIAEFIARSREKAAAPGAKQRLVGFKFLRLSDDPLAQLRQLDGPDAPRVTLPNGAGF